MVLFSKIAATSRQAGFPVKKGRRRRVAAFDGRRLCTQFRPHTARWTLGMLNELSRWWNRLRAGLARVLLLYKTSGRRRLE